MLDLDLGRIGGIAHGQRRDEGRGLAAGGDVLDDVAPVGAQHATLVAHADVRGGLADHVEQARGAAAEPGILAVLAVAADHVVPVVDFRQQFGNLLRRVLQIGVERHDHLAAGALEGRHDRHVLAEVAVEVDHAHLFRALLVEIPQQCERIVAAAVVGKKDFVGLADPVEHRRQTRKQCRQVFLFVVHRYDDCEIGLGHAIFSRRVRPSLRSPGPGRRRACRGKAAG